MEDSNILWQFITSIILLYIGWWILTYDKRKARINLENQFIEKNNIKESHNITSDNVKYSLYGDLESDYCVINNDNELLVVRGKTDICDKIDYNDILDMKIDIHTIENNKRRIVAFTATYDKNVSIARVDFKLITTKDTYTVYYTPFAITPDGEYNGNIADKIDDTERFKLIVEKEIKKNESNSI